MTHARRWSWSGRARRRRLLRLVSVVIGLGIAGWFALAAGHARADEKPPAEITDDVDLMRLLDVEVSTATKTNETVDAAPAVITVVTRKDIERWGYQSVAEVLSHTVGFYLIDDHILPNAGVRGMTGGQGAESGVIKVMIDGRSVAYRRTSGNWLGVELIPLSSVAQIEIIRGPASALYGADAFLGVVNIITVRPDEMRQVRARVALGSTASNPGGRFDLTAGSHAGNFHFLVAAAGETSDRSGLMLPDESPAPILPSGIGDRRTALNLSRRSLSLEGRVGYIDDRRGHVTVSGFASALERGGDFAHWAQLTNGRDAAGNSMGTVVALGQLRLNLDGLLHVARTVDLSLAATYFQGGVRPADRIEIASDLFYIKRRESYLGMDATAEARWMPSGRFNLIAGTEAVIDRESNGAPQRIDRVTGQVLPQVGPPDASIDLVNLGIYASSNLKVIDPWLKLTGGLRYDHHSVYGEEITGRGALTAQLTRGLVAKLLYGTAFKAPSPYLLYATPLRPGDVVGNRNLKPQRIHTGEFQTSWSPNAFFAVSSGVSYNWLLDKAEFTPQGINQSARNVASQRTLSWETRADVRYYDTLTAYGAFELVHSVRDLGQEGYAASLIGTKNVVYPPWIARAGLSVAVPSPRRFPLTVGAEAMLVGPRRADDTSIVENGSEFYLPVYGLLDAFVATREVELIRGQESRVAVRGRNLLGTRGPDPGFAGVEYPLAPREIFLELQHAF